jgi:ribosome maturation protein SDO1
MDNVRINIDPFKPVEEQAQEVIKALRTTLPLKISQVSMMVQVGKENAGKVKNYLTKTGNVVKSDWLSDGSWKGEVVVPAGMQQMIIDRLNELTRGNIEVNIIKKI